MKNLQLIIILFFSIISYSQTNYYVSPTGNNSNSGTTIATAWQTIQKAANTAIPGSTVNILAGTYNELVTINVSGTNANPITFKNYQNQNVVISGVGFSANFSNLITINSKSNIVIDGLILENLTTPFARGILVLSNPNSGIDNITLRNLKIRYIGFSTNANLVPTANDNAHGIEIYGQGTSATDAIRNITIENCEVYNNINGFSENITINGNVDGYSILNNLVHDNTNIGIDVAGNFGASSNALLNHARNGVISGNTTFNNNSQVAISSGIYCDGCWNTVIERNQSYNNAVGITAGCEQNGTTENVIIRNNIVYNNTYTGIQIGGYNPATTGIVINSNVNNNTLYFNDNNNLHGQIIIEKTNNCNLFQNILHSNSSLLFYVDNIAPQSFTIDYNDYFTTANDVNTANVNYQFNTISYTTYKTNTGFDVHSIYNNPLFVNSSSIDFNLQTTSPCINAGNPSFTPSTNELDYYSFPRISNSIVDIGASEYQFPLSNSENFVSDFKIFPNPAINNFQILNADSEISFQIFDCIGNKILEKTILENQQIDISNFSNGIYFVKLFFDNKTVTKKLIIKK
ncbi:T9SS type A sorting domain-containing protein [Flavobacterium sp.]|uniref:T9SS type A sorting domain-containing protein n=1 Tax=Flavobacterium sp. TaxID=239 RepID=UPI003753CE0D